MEKSLKLANRTSQGNWWKGDAENIKAELSKANRGEKYGKKKHILKILTGGIYDIKNEFTYKI